MIVSEQAGPSSLPDGEPIAPAAEADDVFAEPSARSRLARRFRDFVAGVVDGWHAFRAFMWNKEKREVMGRNGKSWAQIGLFYLCFYVCLAGFFAAIFAIFYQTISLERPKYTSLIIPPGLNLFPFPDRRRRIEYGLAADDEDRIRIEQEIKENVFQALSIDQSTHVDCPDTSDLPIADPPLQRFCRYNASLLGPCAPNESGYNTTQPCLYMGLNKVWGWVPKNFSTDELSSFFNNTTAADFENQIFFTCSMREEGQPDKNLTTYPRGVSFGHYPYVVGTDQAQQARYIRPVVAVKLDIQARDVDVRVECRARAGNIPDEAPGGLFNSREEPSRFRIRVMVRS